MHIANQTLPTPIRSDTGTIEEEQVLVTLTVDDQLCGVPVLGVRDVLAAQVVTRIPLASPEIAGSLNLRGRIVTAVDLRRRLRLAPSASSSKGMFIVTEMAGELYALLVDQVSEVLALPASQRESNPPTLSREWASYSTGIYRLANRLLVVLDVERLLAVSAERM